MAACARRFCSILLFVGAIAASQTTAARNLDVRINGDHLRVAVNRLRLLTGAPLQKLRDGASVIYAVRLTALSSQAGSVLARADYRFVISFDIFEERFQVSRIQPSPRVVSHLSMAAAEGVVFELSELPLLAIRGDQLFWMRWEYKIEDPVQSMDTPTTLDGLVDLFGRRPAKEPARSVVEDGPFKLSALLRVTRD